MIENKNQFKKMLKDNKVDKIIRIYNFDKNNKIPENEIGTVEKVNSNSFLLKWNCLEKETWTYFENIEVKNGNYYFYSYLSEEFEKEKIEYLKSNNIEIIPLDEKEYLKVNKDTNANYKYKFVVMTNKIVEVQN